MTGFSNNYWKGEVAVMKGADGSCAMSVVHRRRTIKKLICAVYVLSLFHSVLPHHTLLSRFLSLKSIFFLIFSKSFQNFHTQQRLSLSLQLIRFQQQRIFGHNFTPLFLFPSFLIPLNRFEALGLLILFETLRLD